MKTVQEQFSKISSYQGSNFKEWFGPMPFKKGEIIKTSITLEKSMNDKEIMDTYLPEEVSIGDVYATVQTLDKKGWYIFYCKDKDGILRAASSYWGVGFGVWRFYADPVGRVRGWDAGDQVMSRGFSESKALRSVSPSDTLTLAIETCKKAGYQVSKVL